MDLNILWFILITVLFIGFFFLEGFDYGVGMLLPFLSRKDRDRRVIINSIGTFWDGNEVWLLTAGGAMFAAFPNWYATLFSGFYLPLFLMLLAIIVRAVAFEFRSKDANPTWRSTWDWMIFFGSAIPALLWGVAFSNVVRGIPIDGTMTYTGGFFNLLNPFALVGGITFVVIFLLHGAIFLNLKTTGDVRSAALAVAKKLWGLAVILLVLFVVYGYFATDLFTRKGSMAVIPAIPAAVALLAVIVFLRSGKSGLAFILTGLTIASSVVMLFTGLFPRVMISSTNPAFDLTIYNASSSPYTLKIMSIVAAIFVPIVLIYQSWTYWVFRQRVTPESELEY